MKKAYWVVFLCEWVIFQTFIILLFLKTPGSEGDGEFHFGRVFVATFGAVFGPMAGAIARPSESSAVNNSLAILPWFIPFLLIAILGIYNRRLTSDRLSTLRMIAWGVGWLVWMFGSVLSLGYALG